jgi:tetratricopeptide (TPR) repeat protein
LALCAAAPAGCARTQKQKTTQIVTPSAFTNPQQLLAGLNQLALLPEGSKEREALRQRLVAYVAQYIDASLEADDPEEAMSALEHALGMFTPSELRAGEASARPLAKAARHVYEIAARSGQEDPSILALAAEYQFGEPAARKHAQVEWENLVDWVENGNVFAREIQHAGGIERRLEEAASVFPSPWLVDQLADIYLQRYRAARRAQSLGEPIDDVEAHRIKYTPYLLARVYLRADDLEGAAKALEDSRDPYMSALRDKVVAAATPARTAQALNDLIGEIRPTEGEGGKLPPAVERQAWGIVDNLARRALREHPDDVFGHFFRAEALRRFGLRQAAMVHYEQVLEQKQDVFEVWAHLAAMYQEHLLRLSVDDVDAAVAHLPKVEKLHAAAVEKWPDRPIQPGLVEAYLVVADALYDAGRPDEAVGLLDKSIAIEPTPDALDLLGTIAAKRGDWDTAWSRYEELMLLPFPGQSARLFWEIRAQTQLGEIAIRSGRPAAGERQLKAALGSLNQLLAMDVLPPEERVNHLVERSRVLFYLGEVDLAMDDFRAASELAPEYPLVYAEPMLFAGGHGYYGQALEVFQRAMSQVDMDPSLRLYFSLWMMDLAQRQGHAAPAAATAYIERFKGDSWHRALAEHAVGKRSYKKLLAAAKNSGQRAEAHFYEGLRRWRDGDTDGGLELMRKVLETKMMSFFEYEMAQNYLSWKDLPRTARSPLAAGVVEVQRKP